MFSDLLPKKKKVSYKALFWLAAGLGVLGQLVAMALVVDGQVQKAQQRDARRMAEANAISLCMDAHAGAARQGCIALAKAADAPVGSADAAQGRALASLLDSSPPDTHTPLWTVRGQIQGLVPVSLASRH